MKLIKENTQLLLITNLIIIFLLILLPYFLIPRHQDDDYWFFLEGISLKKHLELYFTMSGRVIVDYISSAILQINNRFLMVILTSLVIPIFIYVIATIPFYKQAINYRKAATTIWLLFIIVWTTNPALGDTFFWIVGETNYILPLLVFAVYIKFLLTYINSVIAYKQAIWLGVLAFLGGLSNEATSLMVIYLTACFILLSFINRYPNTKLLMLCLTFAIIGSSILLLAPGNFERAVKAGINHYNIWQKLGDSFPYVLLNIARSYGIIYLIILLFLSYCWRTINKEKWWIISILTSAFILALFVLSISPGSDKPRTYITGVFFLWVILSFLLKEITLSQFRMTNSQKILFTQYMIFFCISYYYVVNAYNYLYKQEKLRIALIKQGKNEKIIHIPSYERSFTLRKGDLPCLFNELRSEGFMAQYFKVPRIILDNVEFNYIALLNGQESFKNYQLSNVSKLYIKKIFIQQASIQTTVIVEFIKQLQSNTEDQSAYLVSLTLPTTSSELYSMSRPLIIYKIKDRFFGSINIPNMLLKDKKYQGQISIKIIDKNKKENTKLISILFSDYWP